MFVCSAMDDLEVGAEPPAKRMRPNRDVLEKYMLVDIDESLRAVKAHYRGLRCIDSAELTLADFNSDTSVHSMAKKTTSPSSPYLSQTAEHLRSSICHSFHYTQTARSMCCSSHR